MNQNLLKNSISVFFAIFIGRILGFLRDVLLAASLGQTYEADVLSLSLGLPDIIMSLFLGGSFSAVLMPIFMKASNKEKEHIVLYLHLYAFFFLFVFCLIIMCLSDILAKLLVPNMPFYAQKTLGTLLKISCWAMVFIVGSSILSISMNARGLFFFPSLGASFSNIAICFSLIISFFNESNTLTRTIFFMIVALGIRWILQIKSSFSSCPHFVHLKKIKQKIDFKKAFNRYIHIFMSSMFMLLIILIARIYMARTGAGQLSNLNYAQKIIDLFTSLISGSFACALLPKISDEENHFFKIKQYFCFLFFSFLIIALLIYSLSPYVVPLIFEHGKFNHEASNALVMHIKENSLVLPFYASVVFLTAILAATKLYNKNIYSCFIGFLTFIFLMKIKKQNIVFSDVYIAMCFSYFSILSIQLFFLFFSKNKDFNMKLKDAL